MSAPNHEQYSVLKYLFSFIRNNFWVKILSIFFAIILFLVVRTDQNRNFDKLAKLKIIPPQNSVVIGGQERYVEVKFTLQNSIFATPPSEEELIGEIDLTHESAGQLRYRVTRENFPKLDKKYSIFIERPILDIELDVIHSRNLPIKVLTIGNPIEGLIVDKIISTPQMIKVTGAKKYLRNLDYLNTEPISIQNINTNLNTTALIAFEKKTPLTLSQNLVSVEILLSPKKFHRIFHSVPIELKSLARHLNYKQIEMRPSYVEIEIEAPLEVLNQINPSDIHATIDSQKLVTGWQEKKVVVKIPEQSNVVQITPNSISVYLAP
ncbi:MAG: hypothetical protein K2X39_07210 [Silvanigrellaceae bacterium]|nr:hypothetical protein [Silvanigrellaceae bacterium]